MSRPIILVAYPGVETVKPADPIRAMSRTLSGYLCGTHSGVLAHRRGQRMPLAELAEAHAQRRSAGADVPVAGSEQALLGARLWQPSTATAGLANKLRRHLDAPGIVDLLVFGSHARASTTGYSDLDAILVVDDDVAEDPRRLMRLRQRVLAAQRAAIAYQPMQHHAFEVATPTLLAQACRTLAMPPIAVRDSVGLFARPVEARFQLQDHDPRAAFETLAANLLSARSWPAHPWRIHLLVSQFELIPVLYLQCRDPETTKADSFAAVRDHFPDIAWPFDALARIRDEWRRRRYPVLSGALTAVRNPWAALALWRRTPQRPPIVARELLQPALLASLQRLVALMVEELRARPAA